MGGVLVELIFWSLMLVLFWLFFGYGLLVFIVQWCMPNAGAKNAVDQSETISFTIILALHNEERVIAEQLDALLLMDYPKDRFNILVSTDGCSDKTVSIVQQYAKDGVVLLKGKEQKGKTHAQNRAIAQANGEWLLFMDAGTGFSLSLLKELSALINQYPEEIACIQPYFSSEKHSASKSFFAKGARGIYDAYEQIIKKGESQLAGLVSVAGLCYTVRSDVCPVLLDDEQSDFAIPLALKQAGYKAVLADGICVYELFQEGGIDKTFQSRFRIALDALHMLVKYRALCRPDRYGFFSVEFISHKWLRYLLPFFLLGLLFSNGVLVGGGAHGIYLVCLLGQAVFYLLAFIGFFQKRWQVSLPFYTAFPCYFMIAVMAFVKAWYHFLQGKNAVMWSSNRDTM